MLDKTCGEASFFQKGQRFSIEAFRRNDHVHWVARPRPLPAKSPGGKVVSPLAYVPRQSCKELLWLDAQYVATPNNQDCLICSAKTILR